MTVLCTKKHVNPLVLYITTENFVFKLKISIKVLVLLEKVSEPKAVTLSIMAKEADLYYVQKGILVQPCIQCTHINKVSGLTHFDQKHLLT